MTCFHVSNLKKERITTKIYKRILRNTQILRVKSPFSNPKCEQKLPSSNHQMCSFLLSDISTFSRCKSKPRLLRVVQYVKILLLIVSDDRKRRSFYRHHGQTHHFLINPNEIILCRKVPFTSITELNLKTRHFQLTIIHSRYIITRIQNREIWH